MDSATSELRKQLNALSTYIDQHDAIVAQLKSARDMLEDYVERAPLNADDLRYAEDLAASIQYFISVARPWIDMIGIRSAPEWPANDAIPTGQKPR